MLGPCQDHVGKCKEHVGIMLGQYEDHVRTFLGAFRNWFSCKHPEV